MKIAILTPTFSEFSGIDRVVEREAQEYHNKGHNVTLFCFKAHIKSSYCKVVEMGMPKNQILERVYRLFFFLDMFKVRGVLKRLKGFDKIICHQYPMTVLGYKAKKKYGTKYLYYDAGVAYPELFKSFVERNYLRLFNWFTWITVKNADEAISISKFLSEILRKETGLKSRVEYVKIDKKRFKKGIPKGIIRKKYKVGTSPLCVYVGRISPHKGIHLLIKAFNLVLKDVPNAKLIIVGKRTFGRYGRELEILANKVNKNAIIFTGFVSDKEVPYFYTDADLYTTATLWEGFDMPIVEAAYCGTPTVAFNIGAHPEVMEMGKLVKLGNINEFSKAIITYLIRKK
jgi:1,2-diacylglycerol 3-alpha-glucosyltransferase